MVDKLITKAFEFFSQLIAKNLFWQKNELLEMYGKNLPSVKKHLVVQGLKIGKTFDQLAQEMKISRATAEVYAIDSLAAGQEVDHETIAKSLEINEEDFQRIKGELMSTMRNDKKLRTVRDNLGQQYGYNQIRFVLACQIQELEL